MKIHKTTELLDVQGSDISGPKFHDVNISGASFDDVNMSGWRINNVNLAGLQITKANMAGAAISDARMSGMTIDGVLVADLFAAYETAHRATPVTPGDEKSN